MPTYSSPTTPFKMPARKPRTSPGLPSIWINVENNALLPIEPNTRSRSAREVIPLTHMDQMETARRKLRMAASFEDVLNNGFFVDGKYQPTVQFSLTPTVARQ
ncbi:hypothetical protein K7432_012877 [Basidiobolus ranarum]|uniref:Uncharacterized protein n=1 Tax=Basidiobolus ranarum TaxID=34480 RepID=A0ABR2VRK2_9FUNG